MGINKDKLRIIASKVFLVIGSWKHLMPFLVCMAQAQMWLNWREVFMVFQRSQDPETIVKAKTRADKADRE